MLSFRRDVVGSDTEVSSLIPWFAVHVGIVSKSGYVAASSIKSRLRAPMCCSALFHLAVSPGAN
jgi:hypothetical protein